MKGQVDCPVALGHIFVLHETFIQYTDCVLNSWIEKKLEVFDAFTSSVDVMKSRYVEVVADWWFEGVEKSLSLLMVDVKDFVTSFSNLSDMVIICY